MNDDQRLLANAVLDGDVTSDERSRAEADPEVAAEVERLRGVRSAVRDVDPPDPVRRESAIAAALAAFDTGRASAAPPPVASLAARRRARWTTPLAAAAAVIVIVAGGLVAVRSGGDDTDDAASLATSGAEAAAELESTDRQLVAASAPTAAPDAAADADGADDDLAAAPADTESAADATLAPSAEAAPSDAAAPLTAPADLVAFVRARGDAAPSGSTTCAGGQLVGRTTYVVDGVAVPVEVLEVETPHQVIAVRVDDCREVARAPLP